MAVRHDPKYVLDSCIWIKAAHGQAKVLATIQPWIQADQVAMVDLIMAEVLREVRSQKDFNQRKQEFLSFPQLSTPWEKVAHLAFQVRQRGFHPPLADLYIAQCMIDHKKTLVTQDKDFVAIAKVKKFSLKLL